MVTKIDEASSCHGEKTPEVTAQSWMAELSGLLERAADIAVAHGAERDQFMALAHDALVSADPELRAQMERESMIAQMNYYRRIGVLAEA